MTTVTKFRVDPHIPRSRPRASGRQRPFPSMVTNLCFQLWVYVVMMVESYLAVPCPSPRQSTRCRIVHVVQMLMVVGRFARLVVQARRAARIWSPWRVRDDLATLNNLATPPHVSGRYVPRSHQTTY